jgi:MoaA/NifB/PqqE/SkfB family radical SAM enzyme
MSEQNDYLNLMNRGIRQLVVDALKVSLLKPGLAYFIMRSIFWQKNATRLRQKWEEQGVHVPPFMIISVTNHCNLKCKGCYAIAHQRGPLAEMDAAKLIEVIGEARDLGISIILLAGGEPLTRSDLFEVTAQFPEIIFPVFTNGLLLNSETIARFKKQKNVLPIISMEGMPADTDARRGQGIHDHLVRIINQLRRTSVFFGISFTVTRRNFDILTDEKFIKPLVKLGSKIFFFIDYIPVQPGTEELELTPEKSRQIPVIAERLRQQLPALFVSFPGDEEQFGGCLSSGRGFVHIAPDGSLEPCPFAPYSDTSLKELPLRQALQSNFLKAIRDNHGMLSETKGGCALWDQREWVRSLLPPER